MHVQLLGEGQGFSHQARIVVAHGQMRPLDVDGAVSEPFGDTGRVPVNHIALQPNYPSVFIPSLAHAQKLPEG